MEAVSIILITIPILLPVILELDINIYHYAIFLIVSLELAMITPPVGLNLFVVSSISDEPLEKVVKAVIPFLGLMIVALVIIAVWPSLSLFLIENK